MLRTVQEAIEALDTLEATVRRCRDYCRQEPHNRWDDGELFQNTIIYTCEVCGRKKRVPA